jgi:hypothetical protein
MPGGYVGGRPKDESKLSTKPEQVRRRLRRAAANKKNASDGRIGRDMEKLYRKPIEQWDNEELARGRPRNRAGDFRGIAPTWITPEIHAEAKRRLVRNTFGTMAPYLQNAIKVVADLMMSEEVDMNGKPIVDARTRLAAATFFIENFIGKPTAHVEVSATENVVHAALVPAIVLDDGDDQSHLVLEGEYYDDDEMQEIEEDEHDDI